MAGELNTHKNPPPRIRSGQDNDDLKWLKGNYWVLVESSNVRAIRYDPAEDNLYVWFLNGSVYQYQRVGTFTAQAMFHCDSMGRFVWARLRDRYGVVKLK